MAVKEIEIRLALVLYGGVSLAVYIHGVTRELLNLVRASKGFQAPDGESEDDTDTVAVYRQLFKDLAPAVDLRVVVDVISGASAGGINGIMLARAIAHDLPIDEHRSLWLQNADVTKLSAPSFLPSRLAKAVFAFFANQMLPHWFGDQVREAETRTKLLRFMQAPWFRPPFSGSIFTGWLFDACDAMDQAASPGRSLLPPGHRLDLFVTLTDYRGHRQRIALHDPAVVEETEHRRIVLFSCRRALSGEIGSEFTAEHVPELVFAARATSSFPGAFQPATVAEIDRVLAERGRGWPGRTDFVLAKLGGNAAAPAAAGRYFIDGSVVMNKPFSPVIHALGDRPAAREVVRRIVYVDPNPGAGEGASVSNSAPGFFRTILSSLALIPRNEPIADDLKSIEEWNVRARRMAEIVAVADPEVERLVGDIVRHDPVNPPTIAEVGRWRAAANKAAHDGAGYAYLSYHKLKLRSLLDRLASLITGLAGRGDRAPVVRALGLVVGLNAPPGEEAVPFLRGFDLDFRVRRVRFVIRRLNELYRTAAETEPDFDARAIDALKAALYDILDRLTRLWTPAAHGVEAAACATRIATTVAAHGALGTGDVAGLEQALGLERVDGELDEIVSVMGLAFLPPGVRRAVTTAYVGFAFYDLITLPILQWTDLAEINEVLVDRISPNDTRGLRSDPVALRGIALMNFGAFFNRTWREHDYLWGRLNAAERCLDIVLSAVGPRARHLVDVEQVRVRLFRAVLRAEAPHLTADTGLVPALLRDIEQRYGPEPGQLGSDDKQE